MYAIFTSNRQKKTRRLFHCSGGRRSLGGSDGLEGKCPTIPRQIGTPLNAHTCRATGGQIVKPTIAPAGSIARRCAFPRQIPAGAAGSHCCPSQINKFVLVLAFSSTSVSTKIALEETTAGRCGLSSARGGRTKGIYDVHLPPSSPSLYLLPFLFPVFHRLTLSPSFSLSRARARAHFLCRRIIPSSFLRFIAPSC